MAYCKNCGKEVDPNAVVCMACGFAKGTGKKYCANCGKETIEGAVICVNCGFAIQGTSGSGATLTGQEQKSKMTAGLLGIFLGAWGVHQFYLGKTMLAIIHLVIGGLGIILFCFGGLGLVLIIGSGIWGIVEGILILTGHTKTDGKGNPLKD